MVSHVDITATTMGFSVDVSKRGVLKNTPLDISLYSRKFEQWSYDRIEMRHVLNNEFYHYDRINEKCYFPKYDLDTFRGFLTSHGIAYKVIEVPGALGRDVSFEMLPHVTFKNEKQKAAVEYLTDDSKGPVRGLGLQTGVGKGQPAYSKIKTPTGWNTMGEMKLGMMVSTPDGGEAAVIGIFPQGKKQVYRVTFEDGRSTVCDDSHLWKVHYIQWKDRWRVLDLKTIRIHMDVNPTYRERLYVPLVTSENSQDVDLPIDPYVLGVLLGDGTLGPNKVMLSNPDQFILDEVSKLLPDELELTHRGKIEYSIVKKTRNDGGKSHEYIDKLRLLGLDGTRSDTKFIPEIYMNGSNNQKLSLLQGLMDTDGYTNAPRINRNGTSNEKGIGSIEFCTTSEVMAKQVQELIWSLGGICKLKDKIPYFTYKGEKRQGKLAYILHPRMKNPSCLFRLPRKKNNLIGEYQHSENLKLRIKSIIHIGEEETQCILIDHPEHLYVTDDYIVTHNTVSVIMTLQRLKKLSMTTMTSRLEQWVSEILKYTTVDQDDIYLIQGVASLGKLFSQIGATINPKIILASTRTIQLYLEYGPTYQHLPHPSEMCEKLGIGIVATDEYHEHFHTNYLIGLILNPALFIPITATFLANDPFVKTIFNQSVPSDVQFTGGEYDRYVNVTSYMYQSGGTFIKPFNYTARGGYSQVVFENFLLSKRGMQVLDPFLKDALIPIVKNHYLSIAEKGERLLLICATKEMCNYLKEFFKRRFQEKTVSVFYSGMPSTILETFDIILSTPGSAGTGRDVKNLRTCIVLENTASEIRNTQFLGRLRGPPQMMNEPEYVYISFACIPQHVKYHGMRAVLYATKAKTFKHRTI